jgi:hypothetical protein
MASTTDKDKLIRVSAGTYKLLTKLKLAAERGATQQSMSYKELIHQMATYFEVTKANPFDPQTDVPGLGIKKLTEKIEVLDKRFIGFVREQEKELLKPILSEVQATRAQLGSPVTPATPADLQRLAGHLVRQVFLLFGEALEGDYLNDTYINKFNAAKLEQAKAKR